MKVLLDVNIILDVLLNRAPWVTDSAATWDYEDNLQIACAVEAGLDAIISRDPAGFTQSPIPVLTPAALLLQLAAAKSNSPAVPGSAPP